LIPGPALDSRRLRTSELKSMSRRSPKRLLIKEILAWADAHHRRTGKWPKSRSGPIPAARGESWRKVDSALRFGFHGLPGGVSLAELLDRKRGAPNMKALPPLHARKILVWADAHQRRTGKWPNALSGPIPAARGETWRKVNAALRYGFRGLPGQSSLALLLLRKRGVERWTASPRLRIKQILAWADAHHARTGRWPALASGPIRGAPGETWSKVHGALRFGRRGLPGKSSLARLLNRERGVRNHKILPRLTERQVLAWADAHRAKTGEWPLTISGPVLGAPGETWLLVSIALLNGFRGLPGGTTLSQFLAKHRGTGRGDFTVRQILAWADAYHKRTGKWPITTSGPILQTSWCAVDRALRYGIRGMRGGSSLGAFLAKHRGYRPLRGGRPPGSKTRQKTDPLSLIPRAVAIRR
jgi:hypothetical protein